MKVVGSVLFLWSLATWFAVAGQVDADDAVAPEDAARELVIQLGHEQFAERENASEQLIEIGLPAMKVLREAQDNPDREIRYRAVRI